MIEKGKFYYAYHSYIVTWVLKKFCCGYCCKRALCWRQRQFEYDRYEKAVDGLTEDIDILKYIQT